MFDNHPVADVGGSRLDESRFTRLLVYVLRMTYKQWFGHGGLKIQAGS